jgi:hypothetical protein
VALAAFSTAEHSNDMRDIPAAAAVVEALSREHEVVIVSFHGGSEGSKAVRLTGEDEYLGREYRGNPRAFAHAVVDAGADLVLGHGPHVLRALEVYKGRLIAYSLGNFCTYARFNLSGVSGQAVQRKPGGPVPDPTGAGVALLRSLTAADIPSPGLEIAPDGALRPLP